MGVVSTFSAGYESAIGKAIQSGMSVDDVMAKAKGRGWNRADVQKIADTIGGKPGLSSKGWTLPTVKDKPAPVAKTIPSPSWIANTFEGQKQAPAAFTPGAPDIIAAVKPKVKPAPNWVKSMASKQIPVAQEPQGVIQQIVDIAKKIEPYLTATTPSLIPGQVSPALQARASRPEVKQASDAILDYLTKAAKSFPPVAKAFVEFPIEVLGKLSAASTEGQAGQRAAAEELKRQGKKVPPPLKPYTLETALQTLKGLTIDPVTNVAQYPEWIKEGNLGAVVGNTLGLLALGHGVLKGGKAVFKGKTPPEPGRALALPEPKQPLALPEPLSREQMLRDLADKGLANEQAVESLRQAEAAPVETPREVTPEPPKLRTLIVQGDWGSFSEIQLDTLISQLKMKMRRTKVVHDETIKNKTGIPAIGGAEAVGKDIAMVEAYKQARFGQESVTPEPVPAAEGQKIGKKLTNEYVYHNTTNKALNTIEQEGMSGGSFSDKPGDFGRDVWVAVKKSDLPDYQTHQYGKLLAHEPNWEPSEYNIKTGEFELTDSTNWPVVPVDKIYLVDKQGKVIRQLGSRPAAESPVTPQMPPAAVDAIDQRLKDEFHPIINEEGGAWMGKNQAEWITKDGDVLSIRKRSGGVAGPHDTTIESIGLSTIEVMNSGVLRVRAGLKKHGGNKYVGIESKGIPNDKQIRAIEDTFPGYEVIFEMTDRTQGTNGDTVRVGDNELSFNIPDAKDFRSALSNLQSRMEASPSTSSNPPISDALEAAKPGESAAETPSPPRVAEGAGVEPVAQKQPWEMTADEIDEAGTAARWGRGRYQGEIQGNVGVTAPGGNTYWHVVDDSYVDGEPLLSISRAKKAGKTFTSKGKEDTYWRTEADPLMKEDFGRVHLYETWAEAAQHQEAYGGKIVRVDVPKSSRLPRNTEGYPYRKGEIPANWVKPESHQHPDLAVKQAAPDAPAVPAKVTAKPPTLKVATTLAARAKQTLSGMSDADIKDAAKTGVAQQYLKRAGWKQADIDAFTAEATGKAPAPQTFRVNWESKTTKDTGTLPREFTDENAAKLAMQDAARKNPGREFFVEETASESPSTKTLDAKVASETAKQVKKGRLPAPGATIEYVGGEPPRIPPKETTFRFGDDMESSFQAGSKGITGQAFIGRVRQSLERIWNKGSRTYAELPRKGPQAEANESLRLLGSERSRASRKTLQYLQYITLPLEGKSIKSNYDLFRRKVVLEDLSETAARGETLPNGFTAESISRELNRVDSAIEGNQGISDALSRRKEVMDAIVDNYLKSMKDAGVDLSGKFTREQYFRHQVLEYMDAKAPKGVGQKLKTPTKRGFLKAREGSSKLISTNYLQAEYEVLSQMIHDAGVARIEKRLQNNYDIASQVRETAKAEGMDNWREAIPKGYETWQPIEGNVFYRSEIAPVETVRAAMKDTLSRLDLPEDIIAKITDALDDVPEGKTVTVMGGKRREWVIPTELAKTLNALYKDRPESGLLKVLAGGQNLWKQYVLLNPKRLIKYNLRNISGDADALFVGNPQAFRKVPQAISELVDIYRSTRAPEGLLKEWMDRGGQQGLLQVQEMGEVGKLDPFRKLTGEKDFNLFKKYWRGARISTDFREATLRYAAFLDYAEQLKSNNGTPKNWGASIREEVMGLKDPLDRAYKLSNELLGAYDQISEFGRDMRKYIAPFWSWQEVNFGRTVRLFRNAIEDGHVTGTLGRKLALTAPKTAVTVGKFALKATALLVTLDVYNNTRFPDEERELSEDERWKPHIIFGRNKDGTINYFNRLGALGDFLEWFGADEPRKYVTKLLNGEMSVKDIAVDMAKKPVNKAWGVIGPQYKTLTEVATGMKTYPDVFRPGRIRDRGQYLAQQLSADYLYNVAAGKPTRGLDNEISSTLAYTADPQETAYYDILDIKDKFDQERGKGRGYGVSARSDALYYYKRSLVYGDEKAAEKYINTYKKLGGTSKGLDKSLSSFDPLYGLGDDKDKFISKLNPENKRKLAKAQAFYKRLLAANKKMPNSLPGGGSGSGRGIKRGISRGISRGIKR